MKKSFSILALVMLVFIACTNDKKSPSDDSNSAASETEMKVNQDSIDKAHGHKH